MDIYELFRNASPVELKNGYVEVDDQYICLLCGKIIEKVDNYNVETSSYAGENCMQVHVSSSHGSKFEYLIHLDNMKQVICRFEISRIYSEKEVNAIIKEVYEDYVTLRRYLIDFGFMDRKTDGSQYWLKENNPKQV
ncbi:MAG: hypothetical protein CVU90_03610 [Firmicutes bacterium HGW-Firmicutes-15]|nr:MAG: hypothetical protein CVU90_03610 [Firmicutes bacterium HGW-Firmicutes-15]